jgi:hypothetical protein
LYDGLKKEMELRMAVPMSCRVLCIILVYALMEVSRSGRTCLQDSIDLSHKRHPDIDGCLCDGATKLESNQYHRQTIYTNPKYLEVVWNVVASGSRASKKRGIIV